MKFLLQCITCCPIPTPLSPPSTPSTPSSSSSSSSPTSSETDTLFLPRSPTDKNRRRKKPTTRFDVVGEWRPSLYVISEEGVGKRKNGEEKRVSEKRERRNNRWKRCSLELEDMYVAGA
ncbi:hypothetical protein AKJ16_DCAP13342 [Drosera capensis]